MPSHLFCRMKLLLYRANFNCNLAYASIVWCFHLHASVDTSKFAAYAAAAGDTGKRPEHLATVTQMDNRTTLGWVNVPVNFYSRRIQIFSAIYLIAAYAYIYWLRSHLEVWKCTEKRVLSQNLTNSFLIQRFKDCVVLVCQRPIARNNLTIGIVANCLELPHNANQFEVTNVQASVG